MDSELQSATCDINEFSLNGKTMYGKVVYVYDGDTIHLVIKIDNCLVKFNCRLLGIDSPEIAPRNITELEMRKTIVNSAYKSRDYLISRVSNIKIEKDQMTKKEVKQHCSNSTKLVWIKAHEFDKYGRLLVELFEDSDNTKSINQDMIDNKYALAYEGGTKKEFNELDFN